MKVRLASDFGLLWSAATISNVGDGLRLSALPLLAATLTTDPALVAGVAVAVRVPWPLLGLVVGVVVDRYDRRVLVGAANVLQGVAIGVVAVATLLRLEQLWLLYVVAFVLGTGELVGDIASQSLLPQLVEAGDLERANGRLYASQSVANGLLGPPVGAYLFGLMMALPFFVDAASFGLAALLTALLRRVAKPAQQASGVLGQVRLGLSWVWGNSVLRRLTIYHTLVNLVFAGVGATFVLYATETLRSGELGYGLLLSAEAAGGLVGALVASTAREAFGLRRLVIAATLLQGFAYLVLGVTSELWIAVAVIAVAACAAVASTVVLVSLRQTIVPGDLLGRVTSATRSITWGVMPAGAVLGGLLAATFGLRGPFLAAVPVFVVLIAVAWPVVGVPIDRMVQADRPAPAIADSESNH